MRKLTISAVTHTVFGLCFHDYDTYISLAAVPHNAGVFLYQLVEAGLE